MEDAFDDWVGFGMIHNSVMDLLCEEGCIYEDTEGRRRRDNQRQDTPAPARLELIDPERRVNKGRPNDKGQAVKRMASHAIVAAHVGQVWHPQRR